MFGRILALIVRKLPSDGIMKEENREHPERFCWWCFKKEYKMVSTKTQIAGFEFDNCLMNAAGVACMTTEELEEVKNSAAGTFVTKTATLEFRAGNPEPRYQDVPLGSINSMGLPNQGLDYYLNYLLELQETDPDRTFFLSLVGMSPEETHTILKRCKTVTLKA